MAHIVLKPRDGGGCTLLINDLDLSLEVYAESIELVEVGDRPDSEIGFRLTLAIDRLDLDGETIVRIPSVQGVVADRVREVQVLS